MAAEKFIRVDETDYEYTMGHRSVGDAGNWVAFRRVCDKSRAYDELMSDDTDNEGVQVEV